MKSKQSRSCPSGYMMKWIERTATDTHTFVYFLRKMENNFLNLYICSLVHVISNVHLWLDLYSGVRSQLTLWTSLLRGQTRLDSGSIAIVIRMPCCTNLRTVLACFKLSKSSYSCWMRLRPGLFAGHRSSSVFCILSASKTQMRLNSWQKKRTP